MSNPFTDSELEAYLDEALPTPRMAEIEQHLRADANLLARLAAISARRDAGLHSLGAIWRRGRLTCPSREHLGSFLLGVLDADQAEYLKFHLEVIGCRRCQANLTDLEAQGSAEPSAVESRRRKYFQSSAGHLRRK
jgi:hypothetical protein